MNQITPLVGLEIGEQDDDEKEPGSDNPEGNK
jgi:hypothetical protein